MCILWISTLSHFVPQIETCSRLRLSYSWSWNAPEWLSVRTHLVYNESCIYPPGHLFQKNILLCFINICYFLIIILTVRFSTCIMLLFSVYKKSILACFMHLTCECKYYQSPMRWKIFHYFTLLLIWSSGWRSTIWAWDCRSSWCFGWPPSMLYYKRSRTQWTWVTRPEVLMSYLVTGGQWRSSVALQGTYGHNWASHSSHNAQRWGLRMLWAACCTELAHDWRPENIVSHDFFYFSNFFNVIQPLLLRDKLSVEQLDILEPWLSDYHTCVYRTVCQ